VNIATLALSWEWDDSSEGWWRIRPELTSYPTTLADVLGTTKNSVSRVDSVRYSVSHSYRSQKLDRRTLRNVFGIGKLVRLQIVRKRLFPWTFPFLFGYPHQIRLDVVPDDLTDKTDDEGFVRPDLNYQIRGSVPHLFLR
jgi:hypothetical protein